MYKSRVNFDATSEPIHKDCRIHVPVSQVSPPLVKWNPLPESYLNEERSWSIHPSNAYLLLGASLATA